MTEFAPVTSVADYRLLDEGEVLEGYIDGVSSGCAPGSDRSRSYWHGWINGRSDAGCVPRNAAQRMLDAAFEALGDTHPQGTRRPAIDAGRLVAPGGIG